MSNEPIERDDQTAPSECLVPMMCSDCGVLFDVPSDDMSRDRCPDCEARASAAGMDA